MSGNVSLYNETDGRAIPPTPVVGCVGLVPDVRHVPRGWREGDVVARRATGREGLDRPRPRSCGSSGGGAPLSLVHDVGDGGVERALAEAALWSGVGADVEVPEARAPSLLACPAERSAGSAAELEQIGVAGGDDDPRCATRPELGGDH